MSTRQAKSNSGTDSDKEPQFPRFPELPLEIRWRIWQFCTPDPRTIESAIVMIVNLDLSRPKAFLPAANELRQCYEDVTIYEHNSTYLDDPDEYGSHQIDFDSRDLVFNIMQICQEARQVVLETYRLDLNSIIPRENFDYWNDDEDIVYFQCTEKRQHTDAMLHYLTMNRENCLPGFDTIKHLAFRLDTSFLAVIGWLDQGWNYDSDEEDVTSKHNLLKNFPKIDSLSLFLDPSHLHQDWRTGKIVLYPPDPEERIYVTSCNSIVAENQIQEHLIVGSGVDESDPPVVDVYVMLRRRHKRKT